MSAITYLRSAVLLPIVLPFLVVALKVALLLVGVTLPVRIDGLVSLPVAALVSLGPLYILVIGALLIYLRHRSVAAHVTAALAAPLLMALALPAFLWIVGVPRPELLATWWDFGRMCLWVGYGYVALVLVGLGLSEGMGWVHGTA